MHVREGDSEWMTFLLQEKVKFQRGDTDAILVVTCKHRFVYYIHVLLRHISLRDIFTFLSTRFEHRPPEYIIYNNACELQRYCDGVRKSCNRICIRSCLLLPMTSDPCNQSLQLWPELLFATFLIRCCIRS